MLAPSETHVCEVYFADPEQWTNFPMLPAGEPQRYTVRAVYNASESKESKQYGVWNGGIVSDAVRVLFYKTK